MSVFGVLILLNFGIHIYRTNRYNQKIWKIDSTHTENEQGFSFLPQNGSDVSWTRTVNIDNQKVDMYACSFEGLFSNKSTVEVNKWTMRLDIKSDCYVNAAWCGDVEIHQKNGETEKVQALDLRNINKDEVILDFYEDGDIYLFPLKKGDYLIYYPSVNAKELPVVANGNIEGKALIGIIFYWNKTKEFHKPEYSLEYQNRKGYLQGKEAALFIIFSSIWILMFVASISARITIHIVDQKHRIEITQKNNEFLNEEVRRRSEKILEMQNKVVLGMADLIENRDSNTGGHVKRTRDIVRILVDEIKKQNIYKLDEEKINDIVRAAPMHDLGKLSIDNSILSKPGKLTDEEFAIMKTHSSKSGEIVHIVLDNVEEEHFINTAFNIARFHHERWDGRGYPDGLAGEKIPFEARIMAIADVYDALVSKRCYKEAMSFDKAYSIMCENMGTQFAPELQSVLTACREQFELYYKRLSV